MSVSSNFRTKKEIKMKPGNKKVKTLRKTGQESGAVLLHVHAPSDVLSMRMMVAQCRPLWSHAGAK
jgi:hypothetical protein